MTFIPSGICVSLREAPFLNLELFTLEAQLFGWIYSPVPFHPLPLQIRWDSRILKVSLEKSGLCFPTHPPSFEHTVYNCLYLQIGILL